MTAQPNQNNKPDLDGILRKRKIYDVLTDWDWKHHYRESVQRWGWIFPASGGFRWKAAIKERKDNYGWIPAQPDPMTPYYLPGDTHQAIVDKKCAIFCEGETDMAALYSIGIKNVACWYNGAKNVPPTIVEDVQDWGCTRVVFIPDLDQTGLEGGEKFLKRFEDSGIEAQLRRIPAPHNDVNDLLINGVITREKPQIAAWDLTEFTDYLAMLKGDITDREVTPSGLHDAEVNPLVVEALKRVALSWGGKPETHNGHPAIPVYAPRVLGHKRDSVGEHCYFYPDSCMVYDYAKKMSVNGIQLCREWNIDYKALGGFYTPGTTPNKIIPMTNEGVAFNTEPPFGLPTIPVPDGIIKPRRDILKEQEDYLHNPKKQGVGSIRNPILCLRGFEGFGERLGKGKVMLWGAPSGHGKTVSVEMAIEQAVKDKYNVLLWGGEWSNDEYAIRAIQQNGGASLNDFYRDSDVRDWAENGGVLTDDMRPMTYELKEASLKAIEKIKALPGEVYIFSSEYADMTLPKTLEIMGGAVSNHSIDFVIFDYAQLAPKDPDFRGGFPAENAFNLFKAFCIKYNVAGMMTTQVNKDATDKVENLGEQIGSSDFNGIRTDRANLPVAFWRIAVGNQDLPVFAVRILKNNSGLKGYTFVRADDLKNLRIDFSQIISKKEVKEMILKAQMEQGLQDTSKLKLPL